MYYCEDCGEIFEEPQIKHTTYESYYGVWSDFSSHTPLDLKLCPSCGSDNLSPYEYDYEEEEEEND